jgi:hypothetical protein
MLESWWEKSLEFQKAKSKLNTFLALRMFWLVYKCCWLGLDTLDALVMTYKNWPNNAQINCRLIGEGVIEFFCAKDKLLHEHEKNFRNNVILRTSKNTLWFHVHSGWKSSPSVYVGYLLPLFFINCCFFFHLKGLGYVLRNICDCVWPHEPLINDIHCCRFLDLC